MNFSVKKTFLILLIIMMVPLQACQRNISSTSYDDDVVGEVAKTESGTVINRRNVNVSSADKLEENKLGLLAGGALGGVAGNSVGKGRGRTIATIGGAILGATAGTLAEKELKAQTGTEYIVEKSNGSLVTVVQGPEPAISVGQKVFVLTSKKGRSRIIPRSGQ